MRTARAETEPDLLGRLMRATWRAGRWLADPCVHATTRNLLARKAYLDVSAELIDRALSGHLTISARGDQRQVPHFVEFHDGAANFPWRSQAKWIEQQLRRSHEVAAPADHDAVSRVFPSDLNREHQSPVECDMPGASEKVQGALLFETPVASAAGRLTLLPNRFLMPVFLTLRGPERLLLEQSSDQAPIFRRHRFSTLTRRCDAANEVQHPQWSELRQFFSR